MEKVSVWKNASESTNFPDLNHNITVDVAIIGGGITGITAAYILANAGKKVAVLEARKIGGGSTGYSTGNLYSMVGHDGLYTVKSKWNEDKMREVVESRSAAVDFIEERIKEFSIECDFRRVPWCLFTDVDEKKSFIKKEREAAEKSGLEISDNIPFPLDIDFGFAVNNQAQFNPHRYVTELAKSIESPNCSIYENTKVIEVKEGDPCILETSSGTVTASRVIMATHTPKGIYKVHSSLGPYREYAVAVTLKGEYPPPGIFWNMQSSEHYSMRTYDSPEGKMMMVLGETHKVGQKENNEECYKRLEEFLRSRFDVEAVVYKWSAQNYRAADGIPYIGKSSGDEKTYIATGFAADGLTYGTLAAIIISDEITGNENKWANTYDASRTTPLASAKEFVKENINVLGQYLKDLPGIADVKEFDDVKPGEGKVVLKNGEKIAAYRDNNNNLHICSAVCTHMECIVNWNEAERSWDCPCHGSRFDYDGSVIEGPAILDLPRKHIS